MFPGLTLIRYHYRAVTAVPAWGVWLIAIVVLGQLSVGQDPEAQPTTQLDRIELRQGITSNTKVSVWNPLQVMTIEGQVQSFDAKTLVVAVRSEDGKAEVKTISSDQVQRVLPSWRGAGTEAAVQLFQQHQYAEFAQALRGLELSKIPGWQQVIITGMVVQAYAAHNQPSVAGDTFIELAKLPIPEIVYADMPLCWSVTSVDVTSSANKWIEQDSEAAKLLGASWLLLGPDAPKAKAALAELQKSKSSVIAQLAKTQAWRLVPAPDSMAQLPSWIAERDRMLPALALGPTEFLSDRLMRIGQQELAIGFALQIATAHTNRQASQFPRARRALVSAAEMLKKQQRKSDAEKVSAWIKQLGGAN